MERAERFIPNRRFEAMKAMAKEAEEAIKKGKWTEQEIPDETWSFADIVEDDAEGQHDASADAKGQDDAEGQDDASADAKGQDDAEGQDDADEQDDADADA
jgi:hypothetical protein